MALSPLFDLNPIDLNAVAVDAETVGAMNPQAGDMRMLDHVIWYSEDFNHILGKRDILDSEFWVPGHIPGRPLFPGVLMIEAAAQLASIQFRLRAKDDRFFAFARLEDTSFRVQVVPGDCLYLLSQVKKYNPRRFVAMTQGIVNDEVAFEARITGMVVKDS